MAQHMNYPPPPPRPAWTAPPPAHGLHITALVSGIIGVIFGLIPITSLIAIAGGLVALLLGFMAWRKGRDFGVKQGRAGMVLGGIALAFGIIGMVIVQSTVDDLDDLGTCLDNADTAAEIDAC